MNLMYEDDIKGKNTKRINSLTITERYKANVRKAAKKVFF